MIDGLSLSFFFGVEWYFDSFKHRINYQVPSWYRYMHISTSWSSSFFLNTNCVKKKNPTGHLRPLPTTSLNGCCLMTWLLFDDMKGDKMIFKKSCEFGQDLWIPKQVILLKDNKITHNHNNQKRSTLLLGSWIYEGRKEKKERGVKPNRLKAAYLLSYFDRLSTITR